MGFFCSIDRNLHFFTLKTYYLEIPNVPRPSRFEELQPLIFFFYKCSYLAAISLVRTVLVNPAFQEEHSRDM